MIMFPKYDSWGGGYISSYFKWVPASLCIPTSVQRKICTIFHIYAEDITINKTLFI